MKAKLDEKKTRILSIITVCLLIILIISASFAYFQAQIGNGTSTSINTTTGTTDVLSFSQEDIDVSKIEGKVKDEDESENVVINASESNFGQNGINLGDGVKAKATLRANNATNETKEQSYNVFLVIDTNTIIYTQNEKRPELILRVTDPEGTEVTDIMGLKYHTAEEDEPNDISGFDITSRTGGYAIKRGQTIQVTNEDEKHIKEQEWQIEIILINLKENQNENTGPEHSVNGKLLITSENMKTYELAHISSLESYTTTNNSISGTLNFTKGTSNIKEYWYKLKNLGTNEIMTASIEDKDGFTLSETGATFTFSNLEENTKYKLYSYIVDVRGFKSDIYETDIEISTDKLPIIKNATVSEIKYNSFKVTINEIEKGSNKIDHYSYHIEGGTKNETYDNKKEDYYVFDNLEENIEYSVEIIAYDEKGLASPVYDFNKQTTTTKTYIVPSIEVNPIVKANSITFNVNATNGDGVIKEYWYKFNQEPEYTKVAKTDLTDSKSYENLNEKTNYSISIKVIDSNNRESKEYSETITTDTLPTVDSVTATTQGATNLTFSITGTAGKSSKNQNYDITSYTCNLKLKEGEIDKGTKTAIPTSGSNFPATCEFTDLESNKEYIVEVAAIDSNGNVSIEKSGKGTTKKICNEGESAKDCLIRLDKENNPETSTLIYHDGKADYTGMPNFTLEAGDLSYRYTGASFKITNAHINDYDALYAASEADNLQKKYLIRFNCNGEEKYVGYCDPSQYYYLDYDKGEEKTQFNSFEEAANQAIKDGYIETVVNNYVCLDGKTTGTTCAEDDLYRIIGLFKNGNNYEMKVIKSSPATSTQLGTSGAFAKGKGFATYPYCWNNSKGVTSSKNTNKWGESNLNTENLNTTFKTYIENKIGSTKIVNHTWIVGGNSFNNISQTANMKTVYDSEITSPIVGSNATEADKTYPAKIGLMYASDYGYAASPTNWTTQLWDYDGSNIKTSNWMYSINNEWTITRNSVFPDYAFYVSSSGFLRYNSVYNFIYYAARPVFYLASSVTIASGNGTIGTPYRIS